MPPPHPETRRLGLKVGGKNGTGINESTRNLAASEICMYSEVLNDALKRTTYNYKLHVVNYKIKVF